jgi:hypothetical protein
MKFLSKRKNLKANKLRQSILAALTVGCVAVASPVFGDGKVTYDPVESALHIPVVHIGYDQYKVTMKHEETGEGPFKFVISELSLLSQLKFEDSKKPNFGKTLTLTELVAKFPPKEFKVFDPLENREKTFRGIPTNDVLDLVYGKDWQKREEVLVKARDGFASSIAVKQFLSDDSFLAFEQVNRPQFIVVKASDGKYVELGSFWLIWDNKDNPALQGAGSYFWPYQAASFDLVTFAERFTNAVPPDGSSEQVQRGFKATRTYCLFCHKVNGDGGWSASELIKDRTVIKSAEKLKEMILDREAHHEVSGMVLREEIPGRDQVADDIIAYLMAMEEAKKSGIFD